MVTLGLKKAIDRLVEAEIELVMAAMDNEASNETIATYKEKAKRAQNICAANVRTALSIIDAVGLLYQWTGYTEGEDGCGEFDIDEYYLAMAFERIAPFVEEDNAKLAA